MEKYTPSLKLQIKANQSINDFSTTSQKGGFYKPPSQVSSYTSQKSMDTPITPDFSSITDFPSLTTSVSTTPKSQKPSGWSQLAKNWAEHDEQERVRKIAEEEKKKDYDSSYSRIGSGFVQSSTPLFGFKNNKIYNNYNEYNMPLEGEDNEIEKSSNPLGIQRDNW